MHEWIKRRYIEAINSMAFYPLIMAIAFISLSIIAIEYSGGPVDKWLEENIPLLSNSTADAANTLLSVLGTGLFTITVFSFSMVMVVLSQAENNFSPKVLEGFLKDRKPQLILGYYIGTLLFCLPIILRVSKSEDKLPLTGIFLTLIFTIVALFAFINFIDYISKSIKPHQICQHIRNRTMTRWNKVYDKYARSKFQNVYHPVELEKAWEVIPASTSGNFQGVNEEKLAEICENEGIYLSIIPGVSQFVTKGTPLYKIYPSPGSDKELLKQIDNYFNFSDLEDIDHNFYFGFRQLMEIAAKALSPAMQDIGTARICIELLTDVLAEFGKKPVVYAMGKTHKDPRLILNPVETKELFELCMDQIRLYGRNDKNILYALIHSCNQLLTLRHEDQEMKSAVVKFSRKLKKDLKNFWGENDREFLLDAYKKLVKNHL